MTTRRSTRRRSIVAMVAILAVVGVFVVRLVDIQVVRAEDLNEQSTEKRSVPMTIYGTRGEIVDANGVVLADSVLRYDITISPRQLLAAPNNPFTRVLDDGTEIEITADQAITEIAGLTGQKAEDLLADVHEDPTSDYLMLAEEQPLEVFEAIRDLGIPGIYMERDPARSYPNGAVAGNLVGFTGTDNVARAGVEYHWDECLASSDGTATYERGLDNTRIPGSTLEVEDARDGGTVHLTIDRDLQWYAQQQIAQRAQEVGADWATAVVVRVADGALMAVADYPTVDPNDYSSADPGATGSRAFAIPYEPGSTFKAATVAMLLDAGAITPTTQIVAPGFFEVPDGPPIGDAWAHGDLRYTTAGALANSSNTGISVLTDHLDAQTRYEYWKKFGIGEQATDDFGGAESSGILHPAENWDTSTNYTVQFGQGVAATSLQVASIYQTLGNNGVRVPLSLVAGCEHADGTWTDVPTGEGVQVVSEAAADQTVQMLEPVASQLSLAPQLSIPGYRIAAKTGTAEVAQNGVYTSERVVSIAGLVPAENPEYAIVVTLGQPDTMKTSAAVAPTFHNITAQVLKTFRVEPSTEPAPDIPLTW